MVTSGVIKQRSFETEQPLYWFGDWFYDWVYEIVAELAGSKVVHETKFRYETYRLTQSYGAEQESLISAEFQKDGCVYHIRCHRLQYVAHFNEMIRDLESTLRKIKKQGDGEGYEPKSPRHKPAADGAPLMSELLIQHFDRTELKKLCADMKIPTGEMSDKLTEFAIDIVGYCQRRGLLDELREKCKKERPNAPWPA